MGETEREITDSDFIKEKHPASHITVSPEISFFLEIPEKNEDLEKFPKYQLPKGIKIDGRLLKGIPKEETPYTPVTVFGITRTFEDSEKTEEIKDITIVNTNSSEETEETKDIVTNSDKGLKIAKLTRIYIDSKVVRMKLGEKQEVVEKPKQEEDQEKESEVSPKRERKEWLPYKDEELYFDDENHNDETKEVS